MKLIKIEILSVLMVTFLNSGLVMASDNSQLTPASVVGSRGQEGHSLGIYTAPNPSVISNRPPVYGTGTVSPGTTGGSVGSGNGVVVCPSGTTAISNMGDGPAKTKCVPIAKYPIDRLPCSPGYELVVSVVNGVKKDTCQPSTAKICPQMAIVCKAGQHSVMDANCKLSCENDVIAPAVRVYSAPAN